MTTIAKYDTLPLNLVNNLINLNTHTFKIILMSSAYTPSSAHALLADITNQLSTGFGYTSGGQALTSVTLNRVGGVTTFDAADVVWTASGGDIGPARYAAIYDDTAAGDPLMFLIDFGVDKTALNGANFNIRFHTNGIATVS